MRLSLLADYYVSREKDKFLELLKKAEEKGSPINVISLNGALLSDMLRDNETDYMKIVLDYYRRNFLEKELDVEKRNKLEKKLAEIVDYMVEDEEISPKMREVLAIYIDEDEVPEPLGGFTYDADTAGHIVPSRHSDSTLIGDGHEDSDG